MRRLLNALAAAAAVAALPTAVLAVFPFDAFAFRARPAAGGARRPTVAFVRLTDGEEAAALRAAKTSWSSEAGAVRLLHADLHFGRLPERASEPVMRIEDCLRRPPPPPYAPPPSPFLPSQAAAAPAALQTAKDAPATTTPPFPREELLKMD